MKQLTIQVLLESAWVDAATLRVLQPELGANSACRLGYELDYALSWMGISLAPIYDFAPMKADPEGGVRTTTWGAPYEEGGGIGCPTGRTRDSVTNSVVSNHRV